MKSAHIKAIAVVGILVVASLAGYLYLRSQIYHTVVQVALPDGLSITAVLLDAKELKACEAAHARFLTPFRQCKDCKILMARCERELKGLELAMRRDEPVPHPMVVARDVRIAVMGSPEVAKFGCETIAKDLVSKGMRSAICKPPQLPPAKS